MRTLHHATTNCLAIYIYHQRHTALPNQYGHFGNLSVLCLYQEMYPCGQVVPDNPFIPVGRFNRVRNLSGILTQGSTV